MVKIYSKARKFKVKYWNLDASEIFIRSEIVLRGAGVE